MVDPSIQPVLDRFEAVVQHDSSVLGVLYTGSLGRGTAGRYSDLDIEVWLSDDAFAELANKSQDLLALLGPVGFAMGATPEYKQANVGPDWRRVDLHLRRRDDTKPWHLFAGARIVKDFDGTLARLVAESAPEEVLPTWEEARATIQDAISEQIYIADNNARRAIWEAMGAVAHRICPLYELLARFRGRRSFGYRYAEALLTPTELQLMRAVWPAEPTPAEVRRAARALWTWTRHAWEEAERCLGRPLDIPIDEEEMLAAVESRYEGEGPV